jgi:hypothetical protein
MERAMLIAFEKAFRDPAVEIQRRRGEAYGNLYLVLAGSYYHSGHLVSSVVSGLKGLTYKPQIAARFVDSLLRLTKKGFHSRSN